MSFDLPIDYLLGMGVWLLMLAIGLVSLLALRRRFGARHRSRLKWVNGALSVWVFLAAFTLVELYFATIYDQSDAFNSTNVSRHWFDRHVKPYSKSLRFGDSFTTYRDVREFPTKLEEGQHHICFLGDSFTFGHGVADPADRFSNLVGADLERKHPGRFVVSNISEVARDLKWAEMVMKELIAGEYPIQTIVFVMCLNDIETFENPLVVHVRQQEHGQQSSAFLVQNTFFVNLAYSRIRHALEPGQRDYFAHIKDAFDSPAWDGLKQKIDEVQRLCTDAGIDLRMVIFPFVHNLEPDYPFREIHKRIVDHCREIGLPVLDLLPVLEAHAGEGLTVNPLDAHPNERAHALAAEAIERDLLGDLLDR